MDNYVKLSRYDSSFDTTISNSTSGVNSTPPLLDSLSQFHMHMHDILQCPRLTRHEEVQCCTWQEVVP